MGKLGSLLFWSLILTVISPYKLWSAQHVPRTLPLQRDRLYFP